MCGAGGRSGKMIASSALDRHRTAHRADVPESEAVMSDRYVLDFSEISLTDVAARRRQERVARRVVPGARSRRASACSTALRRPPRPTGVLLATHRPRRATAPIFASLGPENLVELARRGQAARAAVLETPLPEDVRRRDPRRL